MSSRPGRSEATVEARAAARALIVSLLVTCEAIAACLGRYQP